MELLTEAEITAELPGVPAWYRDGDSITTVTTRKDFRDAMLYVGAIAYLAERANHVRRVHREMLGGVARRPAAAVLQRLRQVPVVQRRVGGDPGLEQRVDELVVEGQAGGVDGS